MPNICCFEACIKGKKENAIKLAQWLSADYKYTDWTDGEYKKLDTPIVTTVIDGKEVPTEHHIGYRVFSYDYNVIEGEENALITGFGDCAWSVYSCMFDGVHTYIRDNSGEDSRAISLVDACNLLNLSCEIFSSEPGMCFAEHYIIKEGELVCEEETEYSEVYIGDHDTFEEYEKYCREEFDKKPSITKEQFEDAVEMGNESVIFCDFLDEDGCWLWEMD